MRDTLRSAAAIVLALLLAWLLPVSAQDFSSRRSS
jgi:hypothetical protein